MEKLLKDHRDKISESDAKTVDQALEVARKTIAGGTVDEINKAIDTLTQASHKLAEAMYKASATPPPGAGGAPPPPADGAGEKPKDNVVDAEFVDVEDKK